MSKLLLRMMVFFNFILVEVQATHIPSTTSHPSSILIPLSHLSKLDNVHHIFLVCVEQKLRLCEGIKQEVEFGVCVLSKFFPCIDNQLHSVYFDDPDYHIAIKLPKFLQCK